MKPEYLGRHTVEAEFNRHGPQFNGYRMQGDVPALQYGKMHGDEERRRVYGMIGFLEKRGYLYTLLRKGEVKINGNIHAGGKRGADAIREVGQFLKSVVEFGTAGGNGREDNHVAVNLNKLEVRLDPHGMEIFKSVFSDYEHRAAS